MDNRLLNSEELCSIGLVKNVVNGFDQHIARQRPVNTFQPTRKQQ
jgi:hypothetical protein